MMLGTPLTRCESSKTYILISRRMKWAGSETWEGGLWEQETDVAWPPRDRANNPHYHVPYIPHTCVGASWCSGTRPECHNEFGIWFLPLRFRQQCRYTTFCLLCDVNAMCFLFCSIVTREMTSATCQWISRWFGTGTSSSTTPTI